VPAPDFHEQLTFNLSLKKFSFFFTYNHDPDPHSFSKLDPDPYLPKKLDPNPHQVNADAKCSMVA
jgi:hypothetical protein